MFKQKIKRSFYRQKHLDAPLLEERLMYLQYWHDNGAVTNTLRKIAQYLLVIMKVTFSSKLEIDFQIKNFPKSSIIH